MARSRGCTPGFPRSFMMCGRLLSLFSVTRRNKQGKRPARKLVCCKPFRPSIEELETRLVPSSLPLHVAGNQLQDSVGHAVVLRGVNIASLEWRPDGDNISRAV